MAQAVANEPAAPGTTRAPACTLVIFGAGGDLTKRLLMPALYDLAGGNLLSDDFAIFGLDHNASSDDEWRNSLTEMMRSFAQHGSGEFNPTSIDANAWGFVTQRLHYVTADFQSAASYADLAKRLSGNAVFYLAVAARFFGPIVEGLGQAGLLKETDGVFRRVIIEKPFGSDLPSARALNETILKQMDESQVFRIDHFLGKEPVQSIMAVRFANGLFEPMWRREYIDHVQITAAETVGVEKRGSFYEATGALRDMVPNHLFQLLTMTAMEPPNSFDAEDVRAEKAKLVKAIRPPRPADVARGQYGAGREQGKDVPGYRSEPDVKADSRTETYVALKLAVENWRWSGVPFYLRTGKRLKNRLTTISVHFKAAPYQVFRNTPVDKLTPNVLTLQIAPEQSMATDFSAKVPGPTMQLGRVSSEFRYDDFFEEGPNVGYETLLYDCMIGDATLFQRADNIESGWAVVQPLLEDWAAGDGNVETYAAGSEGPANADELLARDGRRWLPLTLNSEKRRNVESH
jgi:glucose-6-phosphate 1-dehydrogenase